MHDKSISGTLSRSPALPLLSRSAFVRAQVGKKCAEDERTEREHSSYTLIWRRWDAFHVGVAAFVVIVRWHIPWYLLVAVGTWRLVARSLCLSHDAAHSTLSEHRAYSENCDKIENGIEMGANSTSHSIGFRESLHFATNKKFFFLPLSVLQEEHEVSAPILSSSNSSGHWRVQNDEFGEKVFANKNREAEKKEKIFRDFAQCDDDIHVDLHVPFSPFTFCYLLEPISMSVRSISTWSCKEFIAFTDERKLNCSKLAHRPMTMKREREKEKDWERAKKEVKMDTKTINFEWAFIGWRTHALRPSSLQLLQTRGIKYLPFSLSLYRWRMSECQEMHLNICSDIFVPIRNYVCVCESLLTLLPSPSPLRCYIVNQQTAHCS